MSDPRPYVLLSCALSLDGYLDSGTSERLVLSNDADLARVDRIRASADAILVGAQTVRHDDPRLLVRSPTLRAERVARGLAEQPKKVTVTRRANLDPISRFFTVGDVDKLVYVPAHTAAAARRRLGRVATVASVGNGERTDRVDVRRLLADLHRRGVRRLMVEGGGRMHTQFLTADLVDELQVVVAPFFVGEAQASRFVGEGRFPFHPGHRARLVEARPIGDVVLLRYALSAHFAEAGPLDSQANPRNSWVGATKRPSGS